MINEQYSMIHRPIHIVADKIVVGSSSMHNHTTTPLSSSSNDYEDERRSSNDLTEGVGTDEFQ
jgi:hypothetical protein